GDATKSGAIRAATQRVARANPAALTSSYFSTGSSAFLSRDRHTTFMEVYPPGISKKVVWRSRERNALLPVEKYEKTVDALNLGKAAGTDFLAVSYSTVDYVGHEFGPRSREIQDILVRLDKDLGKLFRHLDRKVGRGNYVVALSADHGVVPIPEDMQTTGADAGLLRLPELRERIEKALAAFKYPKPAVASISGSDIYFAPGVYDKLQHDHAAMQAVLEAALAQPGVAAVYRAEELRDRPATQS